MWLQACYCSLLLKLIFCGYHDMWQSRVYIHLGEPKSCSSSKNIVHMIMLTQYSTMLHKYSTSFLEIFSHRNQWISWWSHANETYQYLLDLKYRVLKFVASKFFGPLIWPWEILIGSNVLSTIVKDSDTVHIVVSTNKRRLERCFKNGCLFNVAAMGFVTV